MDQKQRWLPDLVLLEENNGDWECYIECIYQYFHRDFIESLPIYEQKRWPRAIIDAASTESVKLWKNKRRNEERIILALSDFSYIVVLADRGDYILLWTAYCVEHEHQRRKLEKEYCAYKKS